MSSMVPAGGRSWTVFWIRSLACFSSLDCHNSPFHRIHPLMLDEADIHSRTVVVASMRAVRLHVSTVEATVLLCLDVCTVTQNPEMLDGHWCILMHCVFALALTSSAISSVHEGMSRMAKQWGFTFTILPPELSDVHMSCSGMFCYLTLLFLFAVAHA